MNNTPTNPPTPDNPPGAGAAWLRYAWWGGTASNPTALLRHLHPCRQAVYPGLVMAHYWAVRSRSKGHVCGDRRLEQVPDGLRHDGGLAELLTAAHHPQRSSDAMIIIARDQFSRRANQALAMLSILRSADVPVYTPYCHAPRGTR